MDKNVIGLIVSIIYIGLVLASSKIVAKKGEEVSRKYVHIMLSNWWFCVVAFFDSVIYAAILPAVFVVINTISYKYDLIKTMERKENDGFGTIYYAITLLILSIFTMKIKNPVVGLAGVLTMGYGDGFAAIIGSKFGKKYFNVFGAHKSIIGSITMFFVSLLILIPIYVCLGIDFWVWKVLVTAIVATILEFVSSKGLDNITVPIAVSLITFIFINI